MSNAGVSGRVAPQPRCQSNITTRPRVPESQSQALCSVLAPPTKQRAAVLVGPSRAEVVRGRDRETEGEAERCERGMEWRRWDGAVAEAGMQTSQHSVELKVQLLTGEEGEVRGARSQGWCLSLSPVYRPRVHLFRYNFKKKQ